MDLGLRSFLALSDGMRVEAPRPLERARRRLRRRSRWLSRKQKGSRSYAKAALRCRVRNIRRDTTWLAKEGPVMVVEDLNVRGLGRSPLARPVADVGWGTFRRMLAYKARWYGARLIVAPGGFPSTRRCFPSPAGSFAVGRVGWSWTGT